MPNGVCDEEVAYEAAGTFHGRIETLYIFELKDERPAMDKEIGFPLLRRSHPW